MATNYGDNSYVPGINTEVYLPDQLIAGRYPLVTGQSITLDAGTLLRGTVLGEKTASPGHYIESLAGASDGTQVPKAILADNADASGGAITGVPVYLSGEFNINAMTFDSSWTEAPLREALRAWNIYVRDAVIAADPTGEP